MTNNEAKNGLTPGMQSIFGKQWEFAEDFKMTDTKVPFPSTIFNFSLITESKTEGPFEILVMDNLSGSLAEQFERQILKIKEDIDRRNSNDVFFNNK